MADYDFPSLYWNFLLADLPLDAEQASLRIEDAVPLLFSSVPLSCQTKQLWIEAADDVVEGLSGNSADLLESIGRIARAGAVPCQLYMRHSSAQKHAYADASMLIRSRLDMHMQLLTSCP